MLSENELQRYSRQLPLLGQTLQEKLKKTKVAIVGVGGLGSVVSMYLTALGVGNIVLIDKDTVSISDLNRQILYQTGDLNKPKVFLAKKRLESLNPNINIEAYYTELTPKNIKELLGDSEFIFDCVDNWETRYLLDSFAWHENKILIHGGIRGVSGQVMIIVPKKTACLRCIAKKTTPKETIPVIGAGVGIIGLLQVLLFIKHLKNWDDFLGKLIVFDGVTLEINKIEIQLDSNCLKVCEERLYE